MSRKAELMNRLADGDHSVIAELQLLMAEKEEKASSSAEEPAEEAPKKPSKKK